MALVDQPVDVSQAFVPEQKSLEAAYGLSASRWRWNGWLHVFIVKLMAACVNTQRELSFPCILRSAGELEPRYAKLRSEFAKAFGVEPELFARAPGVCKPRMQEKS